MDIKKIYNEVLTEHNMHPSHKGAMREPDLVLDGVNPSCGDEYTIQLKFKNGVVEDGMFEGSGCAISQASTDMMLDLVIGKKKEEALKLIDIFMNMIKGRAEDEELEELEEAAVLQNISFMPARVKCAVLGWRTLEEMLTQDRDTREAM